MRSFTSILAHTTDRGEHTEITIENIQPRDYTLRLFIENEELGLQMEDNQTWTPVQRPYVPFFSTTYNNRCICTCRGLSPTSEVRVEIQMMGKFLWEKSRQASEVIDLQTPFDNYWSSDGHELMVSSQS